jgi:Ulp1 family protease
MDTGSSSAFSNQYNFNNLPSFASGKRNSQKYSTNNKFPNTSFSGDISFINTTSPHNVPNKVELPFVPSKSYPINKSFFAESRLPPASTVNQKDPTINRMFSNMSKNNLFGHRVWSANSDKGMYHPRNQYDNNKLEDEINLDNSRTEIFNLIKNASSLIYLILTKGGIWILWVLNYIFTVLLYKVRNIPNPEWNDTHKEGAEEFEELVAESTPVFNKVIDKLPEFETKKIKNPLFYKKLNSINNISTEPLSPETKIEKVDSKDSEFLNVEGEQLNINNDKKQKKQYGTYFFDIPKSSDKVNLETCFFKTALNSDKLERNPESMYLKAADIRENLLTIYNDSEKQINKKPIKPSFTRSTTRFNDLEWLIDDREDYLNNLESTRLFKEYQMILEERKKMVQLLHLSKLKEHGLGVRPLKEQQLEEVEKVWMNQPDGILINKFRIGITSRDLFTLSDRHWLNDNIIDFYLQLIKEFVNGKGISKIHVFSTFFYTTLKDKGYNGVKKWAKRAKVDVSELDYIFVPVNLNQSHWALAVIDNVNEKFAYIDSLFGDGTDILFMLLDYMIEETKKNNGNSINVKNYNNYDIIGQSDGPNQQNGFDCGVFTCTAVDYIARNRELDYSQADMMNLRRRMTWEILHGKLLDH